MSGIDAAIAAAQSAAGNIAPAQTAVAPTGQAGTAVAAPMAQAGAPMGLNDAMAGTHVVDEWLKVNEHGLAIGSNKPLLEEVVVELDMSEIAYTEAVKFGNPATYEKTYDRQVTVSGKPWAQALIDARKVQANAFPYKSADLTFTLVDDLELKSVTIEAGTALGHSLSTTGWKEFAKFVKALQKAGIDPTTATVKIKVGYKERTGNGNTWGVPTFELIEEA